MMEHWIETLSYVNDFELPRWKEVWELVIDVEYECTKCEAKFTSNSAFKFHWTTSHVPTGHDFLALVKDYFSLPKQQ